MKTKESKREAMRTYREKHKEYFRDYMREYMRKKRLKERMDRLEEQRKNPKPAITIKKVRSQLFNIRNG